MDRIDQIAALLPDAGTLFDGQYSQDIPAEMVKNAYLTSLEAQLKNPEFLFLGNQEGILTGSKLSWDSGYFGFPVHRLDHVWAKDKNSTDLLVQEYLTKLKIDNCQYVFSRLRSQDTLLQNILTRYGFELMLHKVMLRCELRENSIVSGSKSNPALEIRPYRESDKTFVTELAATASMTSRFTLDEKIDPELAKGLYRNWARNLVEKTPDAILVAEYQQQPAGMVALADGNKLYGPELAPENPMGFISLVAVEETFRGKAVGQTLIKAAKERYASKGYQIVFANTALQNSGSLNMFQKAGFQVFSMVSEYRCWL